MPALPFSIVNIWSPAHPRFPQFAALYAREFQHDTTAESIDFFRGSRNVGGPPFPYQYRLWGLALDESDSAALQGFASFYSMPRCGFGGYLALCGALRGRGLLREVMRRMEAFMRESNPQTHGWYVECEPASPEAAIFKRCGFTQVPISYLQPQLVSDTTGISHATPLELLYKPLPPSDSADDATTSTPPALPSLTAAELKHNLTHILFACYDLAEPDARRHLARMTFPCGGAEDVFGRPSFHPLAR
ncbi:MAG TPA: hypothetical protein VGE39_06455 [Prosthecobacter sp.]